MGKPRSKYSLFGAAGGIRTHKPFPVPAPKAGVFTDSTTAAQAASADDSRVFPESGNEALRFLGDRAFILVFAMVSRRFPVRFLFPIEMKAEPEGSVFCRGVAVEAGESGAGKRADETHFLAVLALKNIPGASEQGNGIFSDRIDGYFHISERPLSGPFIIQSECRESNPGYTHPKRA